jgi:hypothetical protein
VRSQFYNDTLVSSAPQKVQQTGLLKWKPLKKSKPNFPILFFGSETPEEWVSEGASFYNAGDVRAIVDIVISLLNKPPGSVPVSKLRPILGNGQNLGLMQKEISIMSPFREQVFMLREELRKIDLGGVNVGEHFSSNRVDCHAH